MDERVNGRLNERVPVRLRCWLHQRGRATDQGVIRDVSPWGMLVQTEQRYATGQQVSVALAPLPQVDCVVVRQSGDGAVGLRFADGWVASRMVDRFHQLLQLPTSPASPV